MMEAPRSLACHYNPAMIVAALVVSLLGAFTSTQLMSQARGARTLPGAIIWTVLGCLTFGFCAVWCLHFLGMLSCEFDVAIDLNPPLTVLSAILAVSFTFGALSPDIFQKYRHQTHPKQSRHEQRPSGPADIVYDLEADQHERDSSEPLLHPSSTMSQAQFHPAPFHGPSTNSNVDLGELGSSSAEALLAEIGDVHPMSQRSERFHADEDIGNRTMYTFSEMSHSYYSESNNTHSMAIPHPRPSLEDPYDKAGAAEIDSLRRSTPTSMSRVLLSTGQALINGFTLATVTKGFVWSTALTNMHFMGVKALKIPRGYVTLMPLRVVLCAFVSWSVCCVAVTLMGGMEVNIKQQVLFSVVAASGVGAVHFSGMYACSFWSVEPPTSKIGYPMQLPVVIASVAILTCMASTGLLAHSATIARDKLAGIIHTRKRLWAALAQKENAEAAVAARSEFITSASHEIRTPLHQLQGYTDLLSKSELPEEERRLLHAIQLATRSLSMITSNVLDWSRLETGEAVCRPVAVDIRLACETVVHVLPNYDDNTKTELMVIVAPEVPRSVFVDETYLQRILMNLLSNSFKFTQSGYVTLLVRLSEGSLHLIVKDSGRGIPKSFLPQLFEPYKQVQARGAERGTGLGLSITKRLVERMHGNLTVESRYQQEEGVGDARSGSTFALTIPVDISEQAPDAWPLNAVRSSRIAIMHEGKHRDIEGLTAAWMSFGIEVLHILTTADIADITSDPDTIIWVDLDMIRKHDRIRTKLLSQQRNMVLITYKDPTLLKEVLGPTPSTSVVPIQKPLIWHHIVRTIVDARQGQRRPDLEGDLNKVEMSTTPVRTLADQNKKKAPGARKKNVLLVEDNKINQRLGAKMLTTLGYDVLLAEDGQEAIDIVTEHSQAIDAILMDQSMPRKDGITATREIRGLEATGRLARGQIIIAVTAAAGPEAQGQFLEAGTDLFLSKPMSLLKLEQTLAHCLGG